MSNLVVQSSDIGSGGCRDAWRPKCDGMPRFCECSRCQMASHFSGSAIGNGMPDQKGPGISKAIRPRPVPGYRYPQPRGRSFDRDGPSPLGAPIAPCPLWKKAHATGVAAPGASWLASVADFALASGNFTVLAGRQREFSLEE